MKKLQSFMLSSILMMSLCTPVLAENKTDNNSENLRIEDVQGRAVARNVSKTFKDNITALGTTYTVTTTFSGTVTLGSGNSITSYDINYSGYASGPTSSSARWNNVQYTLDANHLYVSYTPGIYVGGKVRNGTMVSRTIY